MFVVGIPSVSLAFLISHCLDFAHHPCCCRARVRACPSSASLAWRQRRVLCRWHRTMVHYRRNSNLMRCKSSATAIDFQTIFNRLLIAVSRSQAHKTFLGIEYQLYSELWQIKFYIKSQVAVSAALIGWIWEQSSYSTLKFLWYWLQCRNHLSLKY